MKRNLLLMSLLAVVFAGAAAWVAQRWIQNQTRGARVAVDTAPVVAAALPVAYGHKLQLQDVKLVDWPKTSVPEEAFADPNLVIGQVTKREFVAGEVLLKSRLSEHLGGSTLSALIAPGKRAITVRVDDVVGVAGFVLPGNQVDVLTTRQSGRDVQKVETLLQNMKVLAVDQEASPEKDKPAVVRAVTLEIAPRDAERLVKALQEGRLQLTLRNPLDGALVKAQPPPTPSVRSVPLPVVAAPPPPVRRAPRVQGVGVISWGGRDEVVCRGKTC